MFLHSIAVSSVKKLRILGPCIVRSLANHPEICQGRSVWDDSAIPLNHLHPTERNKNDKPYCALAVWTLEEYTTVDRKDTELRSSG